VAISKDKTLLPQYLWGALAESSLVLLGYRLQDWDFRVTFRGIVKDNESLRKFSLAIQLDPAEQSGMHSELDEQADQKGQPDEQIVKTNAQKYLEEYFKPSKFRVEWGTSDSFIEKLWNKWQEWSR
jgi:hypothetical protein